MAVSSVDVSNCDSEPVHTPGFIQAFGALVVASERDLVICHASANCKEVLSRVPQDLFGLHLSALLGPDVFADLQSRTLVPTRPDYLNPLKCRFVDGRGNQSVLDCLAHAYDENILLEFFEAPSDEAEHDGLEIVHRQIVSEPTLPRTSSEICNAVARLFRRFTGYDRVMIYRFHEDNHGEVVAESTDQPDSFLGLHYPASDIPDPVRRLFAASKTRMIADIDDEGVSILSDPDVEHSGPVNLTHARLRGVSPIHVEYLRNMGVRASLSTSIVVDGKLWGLISCHHNGPKVLPLPLLHTSELIGSIVASFLHGLQSSEHLDALLAVQALSHQIERQCHDGMSLFEALQLHAPAINRCLRTDTLVVRIGEDGFVAGEDLEQMPDLPALRSHAVAGMLVSDHLGDYDGRGATGDLACAGGALLVLSEDGSDHAFLGRRNYARTVTWGGDVTKSVSVAEDGRLRISPRSSFQAFKQTVSGRSRPFDSSQRERLEYFRRSLVAVRSAERERLAWREKEIAEAKQAVMQAQLLHSARISSMGELASSIAHELAQPLTAITNYVNACRQEIRNLGQTLPADVSELMDDALAEADRAGAIIHGLRNFIEHGDLEPSELDIERSVRDGVGLMFSGGLATDIDVTLDFESNLPKVWADPVQIEQVLFNLVRNSAEAMEGGREKRVAVSVKLNKKREVEVSVRDSGPGIPPEVKAAVFHPFQTTKRGGLGIGLSVCRTIIEAHGGRIWLADVQPGTEFHFTLPVG